MSLFFNMWKGRGQRAKKPADFFPHLAALPTPVQSPKQMQNFFLALAARSKEGKIVHA